MLTYRESHWQRNLSLNTAVDCSYVSWSQGLALFCSHWSPKRLNEKFYRNALKQNEISYQKLNAKNGNSVNKLSSVVALKK